MGNVLSIQTVKKKARRVSIGGLRPLALRKVGLGLGGREALSEGGRRTKKTLSARPAPR